MDRNKKNHHKNLLNSIFTINETYCQGIMNDFTMFRRGRKNSLPRKFHVLCEKIFFCYSIPRWNLSDLSVFFISIVIVIGPTPPGTGVM